MPVVLLRPNWNAWSPHFNHQTVYGAHCALVLTGFEIFGFPVAERINLPLSLRNDWRDSTAGEASTN